MAKISTLSAIVLLALSACSTLAQVDEASTTKDVIAGAAVGAGLAHLAGEDLGTGAVVGGVAGGVAGNIIK